MEILQDKDAKISFLQKAIDVVVLVSGEPLSAKPARIVAGHEPEKTNELLQRLGKCCLSKVPPARPLGVGTHRREAGGGQTPDGRADRAVGGVPGEELQASSEPDPAPSHGSSLKPQGVPVSSVAGSVRQGLGRFGRGTRGWRPWVPPPLGPPFRAGDCFQPGPGWPRSCFSLPWGLVGGPCSLPPLGSASLGPALSPRAFAELCRLSRTSLTCAGAGLVTPEIFSMG